MRINYDPKADTLYIKLSDESIERSDELGKGAIADYDEKGELVGIEILRASRLFAGKKEVSIELGITEAVNA